MSIKFLLVISMLCTTEWSWELWTWSRKMNLHDILSTSPHYFCRKWIRATNENSNFDLRVSRVKLPIDSEIQNTHLTDEYYCKSERTFVFSLVECSILSNAMFKHTTNFHDNGPFSAPSFRSNSQHCNQLIKPCRLLLNGLYFNSLGFSNLRWLQ